ncbi:MAG: universal stress protein [Candidatus Coatesbacteria bacterium]|nr:MAG: universal stress protein [Candidatus Coatesbacteria bacterium]
MAKDDLSSPARFNTLVVSTDGTPFAKRAVETAFEWARRDRAKIIVISVVDTSVLADFVGEPERYREKVMRELEHNAEEAVAQVGKMAAEAGVDAEMIVRRGRPHVEIVTAAAHAEADLIVMGKRSGYRTGRHPIGSVTQRVLEDADCAVLVVP